MKSLPAHASLAYLAALLLLVVPDTPAADSEFGVVRVRPLETDELFPNPGMGWQTFHRFADEDKNLVGLPSASAYFRFYWREIEPKDDEIAFARFDELLAHARRAGQKLAFRVMCTGSGEYQDVPGWLKERGCHGVEFRYGDKLHWVPDFADPLFQKTHFRLIEALGRRYDGHPDLDLVDIGSVGLWGEWHMSDTELLETKKAVPLPTPEVQLAIIEAWCRAFPKTAKVMLIGSNVGMPLASNLGYGWRADCLGDMGGFSKTWNHMDHFYMQQLEKTGAIDVWRKAPVAFESCWDMRKWKAEAWDIRYIYDYALRCHASYMNNKSAPIPESTRPEVERFLKKMGYRLVIREVTHPAVVHSRDAFTVQVAWENLGVAPPYRDYRLAIRLRPEGRPDALPVVTVTDTSVRGWQPGKHPTDLHLSWPQAADAGHYEFAIGVVDPTTRAPAIRLANPDRDPDGWYPLSRIRLSD